MIIKSGKNKSTLFFLSLVIILLLIGLVIGQFISLRKAHSTFENYYTFRGCVELLEKHDTYGICKISSGQAIKIVEINKKWYLDGDGPGVW